MNNQVTIFDVNSMQSIFNFADTMAKSVVSIPDHFKGKTADCMAITLQALQWGMSPYQVAQQTSLINGTLAYGAQLVNAVVSSSKAIVGRFHYQYSDGWDRLAGKVELKKITKTGKNGTYEVTSHAKTWTAEDEKGLWIRVGAIPFGESEIQWSTEIYLSSVLTRNSPEWVTDPQQQIAYLGVKKWSRKYTPAVLLGVYTKDELYEGMEKDITPKKRESAISGILSCVSAPNLELDPEKSIDRIGDAVEPVDYNAEYEYNDASKEIAETNYSDDLNDLIAAIKKAGNKEEMKVVTDLIAEHVKEHPQDREILLGEYYRKRDEGAKHEK